MPGEEQEVERGGGDADPALDPAARGLLAGRAGGHAASVDSRTVLVRDVMTESVVTAAPACSVREVAELMRERNVGSVVLVEEDRPVGFVTDRDLAVSVIADGRDFGDHATDHASAPVITVAPATEVGEAADLMVSHGIRRLPVIDGERIVGILTLDDLAVRTGDLELAQSMTVEITRAALPGFYFFDRGG